jgi:ABC-type phosphonate transport system ATPase subunit
MGDVEAAISQFLSTDPIAGGVALRDLVALGDAGEEALFAKARPYPELRQHQRRWLRYVATRERTVLDRLLAILTGDRNGLARTARPFCSLA